MKLINTLSGGYRRVMDTLLGLQSEMITGINAPFASLGYDLVLSGCAVTDNGNGTVNIAAGLMYVAGQTLRFDGAVNIPHDGSQAIVLGTPATSVPWPFADGSVKNLYSEQKAIVGVQDVTNPFQIKIRLSLYNLQQYIKDQINASEVIGTVKTIKDISGTFMTNFDVLSRVGVTPAWIGWQLDDVSAGMVIVGAGTYTDPVSGLQTIYSYGDTAGEILHKLLKAEGPKPDGLPGTVDGPHNKPADGSGEHVYYLTQPLQNGADAVNEHNNMQPYVVYYRVVKVA